MVELRAELMKLETTIKSLGLEQITGMRKTLVTMVDWRVEYKNLEIATKETQVLFFAIILYIVNFLMSS